MKGFLKVISLIAVLGVVVIGVLFVLDVVTSMEVKDTLQKVLLVLGIIALGGMAVSFITKSGE